MITFLRIVILLLLLKLLALQINGYVVDVTFKDPSRSAEENYCALKKTFYRNTYNDIIYNFTYYSAQSVFPGCFQIINTSFSLFQVQGILSFNSSFASINLFGSDLSFSFNQTNSNFSIANQVGGLINFGNESASISFNLLNETLFFNQTNSTFYTNLSFYTNKTYIYEPTVSMATYVPSKLQKCSLRKIVTNIETKLTQIVIFGGDGPFDASDYYEVGLVFLPSQYSTKLEQFIAKSLDPSAITISLANSTLYDHGLIILYFIAIISITLGALWSKHEFFVALFIRTKFIAGLDDTYENQYYDNGRKEVKTDEHIGKYTRYSSTNDLVHLHTEDVWKTKTENSIHQEVASNVNDRLVRLIFKGHRDYDDSYVDENQGADLNDYPLLGYLSVLIFFVFAIVFIVLLYFFYNVMIYFFYVKFCIGSSISIYKIICILTRKLEYYVYKFTKARIFLGRLPFMNYLSFQIRIRINSPNINRIDLNFNLLKMALAFGSISLVVVWFVYRNESWSWIIQDIMAVSLAIFILSVVRLHSFKLITILLVAFFIYDVFMVFLTPFLTGGNSIMDAVVNGGAVASQSENWKNFGFFPTNHFNRIPIIVNIPNLSPKKQACNIIYNYGFTSLGLGDIIIPGICVNFAYIFDSSASNSFPIYFFLNLLGYLLGLFLAFIGFIFWERSQPALFYLCPVLLIFNIALALLRKEFKLMWSGDIINKFIDVNTGNYSNLSRYKTKKVLLFNILKLTEQRNEAKKKAKRDAQIERSNQATLGATNS